MKFKKKLWISLILFILFGTVFSGWIFHQNTTREHLVFDNTTQLVTTERSEDNIRIEDVAIGGCLRRRSLRGVHRIGAGRCRRIV